MASKREPAADARDMGEDGKVEERKSRSQLSWPNAVTLVLAGETPEQRRWAAETAIEVAKRLGEQRPKVVLTDLIPRHHASPSETLGVEGGAGIADVLMRGEPFTAAARRPGSAGFFFLPLGNNPPSAEVLFEHPRWRKIAARLSEVNAYLLPCVAAEDWELFGPIEGFEACVVVNGTGVEVVLPEGARRLAEFRAPLEIRTMEAERPSGVSAESGPVFGAEPSEPGEPEGEPGDAEGPWRPEGAETAPWARPRERPPGRTAHVVVGVEPERRRWEPRRETTGRALPAWATDRRVIIGAVAGAAIIVVLLIWGIGGGGSDETGAPGLEAAAAPEEVLQQDEPVPASETVEPDVTVPATPPVEAVELPYSVLIASFSSLDDARALRSRLTRADTRAYVAPTPVRGVLYFRVFAGILPERQRASELMGEMVRRGLKEQVNDWDVRPARYAFSFGSYPSSGDASAVVETLEAKGIPAYVVPVPGREGVDTAYRIYAGGFESEEGAGPLGDIIADAGLDAELVERVGLVPR